MRKSQLAPNFASGAGTLKVVPNCWPYNLVFSMQFSNLLGYEHIETREHVFGLGYQGLIYTGQAVQFSKAGFFERYPAPDFIKKDIEETLHHNRVCFGMRAPWWEPALFSGGNSLDQNPMGSWPVLSEGVSFV